MPERKRTAFHIFLVSSQTIFSDRLSTNGIQSIFVAQKERSRRAVLKNQGNCASISIEKEPFEVSRQDEGVQHRQGSQRRWFCGKSMQAVSKSYFASLSPFFFSRVVLFEIRKFAERYAGSDSGSHGKTRRPAWFT
jgi:hypothetical protein